MKHPELALFRYAPQHERELAQNLAWWGAGSTAASGSLFSDA